MSGPCTKHIGMVHGCPNCDRIYDYKRSPETQTSRAPRQGNPYRMHAVPGSVDRWCTGYAPPGEYCSSDCGYLEPDARTRPHVWSGTRAHRYKWYVSLPGYGMPVPAGTWESAMRIVQRYNDVAKYNAAVANGTVSHYLLNGAQYPASWYTPPVYG